MDSKIDSRYCIYPKYELLTNLIKNWKFNKMRKTWVIFT